MEIKNTDYLEKQLAIAEENRRRQEEIVAHMAAMLSKSNAEKDVLCFSLQILDRMELPLEAQIVVQTALARQ